MTNLLARILLSIMVFPLATLIYLAAMFIFIAGPLRRNEEACFLLTTAATAIFVAGYWLWLWRHSVQWTRKRLTLTLLSGPGAALAGVVAGLSISGLSGINDDFFPVFIGGIFAIVLWLPVTVVLWRETAEERIERIGRSASDALFCPRCGYNLTGLHEARCPECGAQFTLNQLYAAQHHREIADARTADEEPSRPPTAPLGTDG